MTTNQWQSLLADFERVRNLPPHEIARWRREQRERQPVRYPDDGVLIEHTGDDFVVTETVYGVQRRAVNGVVQLPLALTVASAESRLRAAERAVATGTAGARAA